MRQSCEHGEMSNNRGFRVASGCNVLRSDGVDFGSMAATDVGSGLYFLITM